jgi:hypothetical protein
MFLLILSQIHFCPKNYNTVHPRISTTVYVNPNMGGCTQRRVLTPPMTAMHCKQSINIVCYVAAKAYYNKIEDGSVVP